MIFISIILCLVLEKWQGLLNKIRCHHLLLHYAKFLQRHVKTAAVIGSWPGLLILLLPLIIITVLIQLGLAQFWYGILGWVFNTIVLLLCLRPHHLYEVGRNLWKSTPELALGEVKDKAVAKTDLTMVLTIFNRDVFAVIFWFCLFGAVGVLIYRAITVWKENAILADSELNGYFPWLTTINSYLDWLPVRFLSLSFALAGDFLPAFRHWLTGFWQRPDHNDVYLKNVATAALHHMKPLNEQAAQELVFRSLVVWIVILALMTITAVIS